MKLKILFAISFLLFLETAVTAQNITAKLTTPDASVSAFKLNGIELVIPVSLTVINSGTAVNNNVSISLNNAMAPRSLQFDPLDFRSISITNNPQSTAAAANGTTPVAAPFFINLPAGLNLVSDKLLYIQVSFGATVVNSIPLNITLRNDITSLSDYLGNKLTHVTKVESTNNQLTIFGTSNAILTTRKVLLQYREILAVNEFKLTRFSKTSFIDAFSIMTIPFKIRPKQTVKIASKDTIFLGNASAGITNVGLNLDVMRYQSDRYFANGKKSTHKLSMGFWVAPSVEELDYTFTAGYLPKNAKSKQIFLSTAITMSYIYNDVSFVFIPYGWDFGTTSIAKEWIYDGKRWWGFGIGISPKILSGIVNK